MSDSRISGIGQTDPKQAIGGDGNPLKPGDVVRLRSGGPAMTIGSINTSFSADGPKAYCHWMDAEGIARDAWFADKALELK